MEKVKSQTSVVPVATHICRPLSPKPLCVQNKLLKMVKITVSVNTQISANSTSARWTWTDSLKRAFATSISLLIYQNQPTNNPVFTSFNRNKISIQFVKKQDHFYDQFLSTGYFVFIERPFYDFITKNGIGIGTVQR